MTADIHRARERETDLLLFVFYGLPFCIMCESSFALSIRTHEFGWVWLCIKKKSHVQNGKSVYYHITPCARAHTQTNTSTDLNVCERREWQWNQMTYTHLLVLILFVSVFWLFILLFTFLCCQQREYMSSNHKKKHTKTKTKRNRKSEAKQNRDHRWKINQIKIAANISIWFRWLNVNYYLKIQLYLKRDVSVRVTLIFLLLAKLKRIDWLLYVLLKQ